MDSNAILSNAFQVRSMAVASLKANPVGPNAAALRNYLKALNIAIKSTINAARAATPSTA